MHWITDLLTFLASLPQPLVLSAATLLAFSETGLGFGLFLPGETGVLVLSTTARPGVGRFVLMVAAVWLGCTAGDSFSYFLGRRFGSRVRETRFMRRYGQEHWDRTARLLHKYGAGAMLIARFLPVVRTLTPVAAGTSKMPYPRFVAASATGALLWSAGHVAIGVFAGASIEYIEKLIGTIGWIVLGTIVGLIVLAVVLRKRRRTRRTAEATDETAAESTAHATTGTASDTAKTDTGTSDLSTSDMSASDMGTSDTAAGEIPAPETAAKGGGGKTGPATDSVG